MAPTNWISRSIKNGGEYNSPAVTIPDGIDRIRFRLDLADATQFADPARTINIRVEVMPPGEQEWQEWFTVHWVGGTMPPKPGQTAPTWDGEIGEISRYAGGQARCHVSSTDRFRWGILAELLPPETPSE